MRQIVSKTRRKLLLKSQIEMVDNAPAMTNQKTIGLYVRNRLSFAQRIIGVDLKKGII